MEDFTGRNLGRYRILGQLGGGGMADIYKAYQPGLDRYVAIKVLPTVFARDRDFLERFRREAKAIAALRHRNILSVYDYGEEGGITYLVMEYVEGGTLREHLGEPVRPERATELIGHIAAALDYAHKQGILHRDVKPANVLMQDGEWPLLSDFGLAKIMGGSMNLTATGVGVGTPAYMSPEQGKGEKVDKRTDVYSLGVILYEMMTGRVPYHAETPMGVVLKHIMEPLPIPRSVNPDIPEGVERVILRAMAKNPDDRYASAGEMAEALRKAAKVKVPTAAAGGPPPREPDLTPADATSPYTTTPAQPARGGIPWWAGVGLGLVLLVVVSLVGIIGGAAIIGPRLNPPAEPTRSEEAAVVQPAPATAEKKTPTGTPAPTPTPTRRLTATTTPRPEQVGSGVKGFPAAIASEDAPPPEGITRVSAYCDTQVEVESGGEIIIDWRWVVAEDPKIDYLDEWMDAAYYDVRVNDVPITDMGLFKYYREDVCTDDGYCGPSLKFWVNVGTLPLGSYHVETDIYTTRAVSDGFDADPEDGKPDMFGPGMIYTGVCDILVVESVVSPSPTTPARSDFETCFLTDYGPVLEGTFLSYAYGGMERAVDEFGLDSTLLETDDIADLYSNIDVLAETGCDVIVAPGFLLYDATLDRSAKYPHVKFVAVDFSYDSSPDNVMALTFREDQAGFLVGALAGMMTESKTVGVVAGIEIPPVKRFRNGYENGVTHVCPDCTVLGVYIDSFADPDAGREAALEQIKHGADVIFGAGGITGSGGILAAAERGAWVIGVDSDEYITTFGNGTEAGSDRILTSAIKRLDVAVYDAVRLAFEGDFKGGTYVYDASHGGVGLAPFHEAESAIPVEVKNRLEEIEQQLADGTIDTGVDPTGGDKLR